MLEYHRLTCAARRGILFGRVYRPQKERSVKKLGAYANGQAVLPLDIACNKVGARQKVQEHRRRNEIDKEVPLLVVAEKIRRELTAHISRTVLAEPVQQQRIEGFDAEIPVVFVKSNAAGIFV